VAAVAIGLVVCLSSLAFGGVQPTLPEPTAAPADPVAEPVPEPTPEPEPAPVLAAPPEPVTATDDESATRRDDDDDDDDDDDERDGRGRKIERAKPGHWGMQFTFGGLAPLSIAGIRDHGVYRLLMTELGFRYVADKVIVPFSVGAGVFHHNPNQGSKQNDAGLSASVGVLKPFRVWRRISPYFGGMFHLHYLDPTGDNNWLFNVAVGPVIGTEFYVGDRVSLLFQGQLDVGINMLDAVTQVRASTSLAAGGQTGLVFYF
jgi:hypothetical protein